MPITLKHIVPVCGLALAFSVSAFAQATDQPRQPGAPQPGAQQPAQPPSSQAPAQQKPAQAADQIARGELTSVDATAKTLTLKPAEGAEQKFTYNDQTKVTGGRGGVAGLATMSGRQVTVHFQSQGANRVATEIEIQGGAPGAAPGGDRPGAPGGDRPGAPGGDRPGAPGGDRPGAPDKPGAER
jgi:hypothetical protein